MARRSGLGRGLGSLIPTEVDPNRASALAEVAVGSIDESQPVEHIVIDAKDEPGESEPLGEGLEKPVDPAGAVTQPAKIPRTYVRGVRRWPPL